MNINLPKGFKEDVIDPNALDKAEEDHLDMIDAQISEGFYNN